MKKKLISLAIVVLVIALFAVSPLYPYVKSLAAMKVYSYINEKESLMDEKRNTDTDTGRKCDKR